MVITFPLQVPITIEWIAYKESKLTTTAQYPYHNQLRVFFYREPFCWDRQTASDPIWEYTWWLRLPINQLQLCKMFVIELQALHILPYHMQSSFQIVPHLAYNQPAQNQKSIVVRLGPYENKEYFPVLNHDGQFQYCGDSVIPREFVSTLERLQFHQMIFHLRKIIFTNY